MPDETLLVAALLIAALPDRDSHLEGEVRADHFWLGASALRRPSAPRLEAESAA